MNGLLGKVFFDLSVAVDLACFSNGGGQWRSETSSSNTSDVVLQIGLRDKFFQQYKIDVPS